MLELWNKAKVWVASLKLSLVVSVVAYVYPVWMALAKTQDPVWLLGTMYLWVYVCFAQYMNRDTRFVTTAGMVFTSFFISVVIYLNPANVNWVNALAIPLVFSGLATSVQKGE